MSVPFNFFSQLNLLLRLILLLITRFLTPQYVLYAYSNSGLIKMTLSQKDHNFDHLMTFEVILSWCLKCMEAHCR